MGDPSSSSELDLIAVGIVRKPHGVCGEASVEPWTDGVGRFDDLERIFLVSPDRRTIRETTIRSFRPHSGRALLGFDGVESPEQVDRIREWTIEIPSSEARALDENEVFLHDLVGLALVDESGRELGIVKDVSEGGGGLLLRVATAENRRADVPFAAEYIVRMDLQQRRMIVKLPEGLLDLSKAAVAREGEE
jgi:16S rRNA processing protein RimM